MTDTVQTFIGFHSEQCRFKGMPLEHFRGHEHCCCDPDGSLAQAHRDFLRRWEKQHVLSQKKLWWPAGATEPIRVKDMSNRYLRNVLAFLERRAPQLKRSAEWQLLAGPQPGGEMAQAAFDSMSYELLEMTVDEWFDQQPLVRRLRKLIRKGHDGPID